MTFLFLTTEKLKKLKKILFLTVRNRNFRVLGTGKAESSARLRVLGTGQEKSSAQVRVLGTGK